MTVPSYYRYWGKAKPAEGAGAHCHMLPYHCLDVAAVGTVYLRGSPSVRKLFSWWVAGITFLADCLGSTVIQLMSMDGVYLDKKPVISMTNDVLRSLG